MQLVCQPVQIVGYIDVIERNGGPYRQAQFASSREQCLEGIRCPHSSAGKETWITGRRTNEIVTTIVGRPDNQIARGKGVKCR